MSRLKMVLLATCWLAIGMATPAMSEDLAGTVVDQNGQAIPGAQVVAQTTDGQTMGTATSNAQGQYEINGLNAGEYFITLAPGTAGAQGQAVAGYVGRSGLTVDWAVAPGAAPIASAQAGVGSASSASAVSNLSFASDGSSGDKDNDKCCREKSKKHYCDNYDCKFWKNRSWDRRYRYCKCCKFWDWD